MDTNWIDFTSLLDRFAIAPDCVYVTLVPWKAQYFEKLLFWFCFCSATVLFHGFMSSPHFSLILPHFSDEVVSTVKNNPTMKLQAYDRCLPNGIFSFIKIREFELEMYRFASGWSHYTLFLNLQMDHVLRTRGLFPVSNMKEFKLDICTFNSGWTSNIPF